MKPSFVIVGGGKVGTALGRQLARNGYAPAGVSCRSLESARKAADLIGTSKASCRPWELTPGADLVWITTPDGAIAPVFEEILAHQGFTLETTVLHCSGALPSTIMKPAGSDNLSLGSMHPLQSFAAVNINSNPFENIMMAVEGQSRAVRLAREAGQALGATCFTIKTEAKTLYHASAVVASNYLVTLLHTALTLLAEAGIEPDEGFGVLSPLIKGTLANIQTVGIPEALTGPIARGDTDTVATHVEALTEGLPAAASLYRQLALHTIPIARAKSTLPPERQKELEELLATFETGKKEESQTE